MLTDVPYNLPLLTDDERATLRDAVGAYSAPLRVESRGLRWHVADALLGVGDALVVAGHALGRLAERLSPHP